MDTCYCCFIEIPDGTGHHGEARWHTGETTVVSQLQVCDVCRRLGCDVLNPYGCKRPEAIERLREG